LWYDFSFSLFTIIPEIWILYARAGMLQFRLLSLSRQSNPSTLTAGLFPKFARTQPPFLAVELDVGEDDDEGGGGIGDDIGEKNLSSPNRASCINGLATLLGGDPQKNGGGDEAMTCVQDCCSTP
jgi:hypothetical protein